MPVRVCNPAPDLRYAVASPSGDRRTDAGPAAGSSRCRMAPYVARRTFRPGTHLTAGAGAPAGSAEDQTAFFTVPLAPGTRAGMLALPGTSLLGADDARVQLCVQAC